MLRPISTNISVITNFGCHAKCWYCIWKGHRLENVSLETDWGKLIDFLVAYKDKGKVSVSGGGDCLYHYDKYKPWWDKFLRITTSLRMLVDVHSREKFINDEFWNNINRLVFSSDNLSDDLEFLEYITKRVKLRITHLATANTTDAMIDDYISYSQKTGCQFTVKQLVGYSDNDRYKEIMHKYPQLFFLDAGDYNLYYMPDNTIQEKFLF